MGDVISVPARDSGSDLILYWEDDTTGLPAEDKEMIFGRVYRKNRGLRLFLMREILDTTGISIRETGEPENGARFEMPYRLKNTGRKRV
jgi:sensor histidine kinase regulating citrate/malate metabolism